MIIIVHDYMNVVIRILQVSEVAVVGRSDDVFGEIVAAVILPTNDIVMSSFTSELQKFMELRIAKYKQPKEYHFVKAIPRNLMGKVRNLNDVYHVCEGPQINDHHFF